MTARARLKAAAAHTRSRWGRWRIRVPWSREGCTGAQASPSTSVAPSHSASPVRLPAPGCSPGYPVGAALLHRWVLREERWPHERFGSGYDAYRAQVPRYL